MEMAFLVVVALATAMTVPVVGALLIFSLMIGPPAAARSFTGRPLLAILLSVGIALAIVWAAIAISYVTNWPVGFFVGTFPPCRTGLVGPGPAGGVPAPAPQRRKWARNPCPHFGDGSDTPAPSPPSPSVPHAPRVSLRSCQPSQG